MFKRLVVIIAFFYCIIDASAIDTASFSQAKVCLDGIYKNFNGPKSYIRAQALSFSENDLVSPSDKGDFVVARKGKCSYQQFKSVYTYSDQKKCIQIDTLEKTFMIMNPKVQLMGQLSPEILNDIKDITFKSLGNSSKMLILGFFPGGAYQKVELVYDSLNFQLEKMNIWFNVTPDSEDREIRKMEIIYLEISDHIPNSLDICRMEELVETDKSNTFKIKYNSYSSYELINLLSN